MKQALTFWQQHILQFFLFIFISALIISPLASNISIPASEDLWNHLSAIIQAKVTLGNGLFPLRLVSTEPNGWYYPFFQFYSSSTYTIAGAIYKWLTPSNAYVAYKITMWGALTAGALYMSCLVYWLLESRSAAIVAAVVYLTAPYTILLVDHLNAFNEIIAMGILPAVLYYTLRQYDHFKIITFLLAGFAWYLLATVHLITFMCTSFTGLILFLIVMCQDRSWKKLFCVSAAYFLGCLLAMWSLAPIAILGKNLLVSHIMSNSIQFYAYSPFLADLLSPLADFSIYTVSRLHPALGIPIFFAVSTCLYACLTRQYTLNKRIDYWFISLIITFLVIFLIAWSPINFWQWLPKSFLVIQVSWRFMGQLVVIGGLLFAWSMSWILKNKFNIKNLIISILIVFASSITWLTAPEKKMNIFPDISNLITGTLYYLIDSRENTGIGYLTDNVMYDITVDKSRFELHTLKPMMIPRRYLDSVFPSSLYISMQGYIPEKSIVQNQHFLATTNGYVLADKRLVPGHFHWNIPLNIKSNLAKDKSALRVEFKVIDKMNKQIDNTDFKIPVEEIRLGGFLNSKTVIDTEKMQSYCQQKSGNTICKLGVPSGIKLIELPAFFYPEMLKITLNGKQVPYISVLYGSYLIPAIVPEPGKINVINIQFRGILWANFISSMAWQLCGLLFLYIVLRKIRDTSFRLK